jgi:polyribonucleotide nucleotidyltransferase
MGLIKKRGEFAVLCGIDFKVAGTANGIKAPQLASGAGAASECGPA